MKISQPFTNRSLILSPILTRLNLKSILLSCRSRVYISILGFAKSFIHRRCFYEIFLTGTISLRKKPIISVYVTLKRWGLINHIHLILSHLFECPEKIACMSTSRVFVYNLHFPPLFSRAIARVSVSCDRKSGMLRVFHKRSMFLHV